MKRRKTIRAGRLVWDITYTVPRPNASKQERKRIREVTEEQVARTNANTAQRKLEMLMATNFDEGDLVLTVTYRDADLPDSADVTRKHLGKVSQGRRTSWRSISVWLIGGLPTWWQESICVNGLIRWNDRRCVW